MASEKSCLKMKVFGSWNHHKEIYDDVQELLREATQRFLAEKDLGSWLIYGPDGGYEKFNTAVAKFLSEHYGNTVNSSDLIPTYGATQGAIVLSNLFFHSGSLVFVDNPTYGLTLKAFTQDLSMKVIPVHGDENGMVIEALEEQLEKHWGEKCYQDNMKDVYWAMVYLIPLFHNPTAVTLSKERCEKIVKLARKFRLLVVCDDVYNLYNYSEDNNKSSTFPPPRLFSYDKQDDPDYGIGHVVSNGTFSKILFPGLRIGWIEAPQNIIEKITVCGEYHSAGSSNPYGQGLVSTILEMDLLKPFLIRAKTFYEKRMKLCCKLLLDHMPSSVKFRIPKGGFFVWLELPESVKSEDLRTTCVQRHQIDFHPGNRFTTDGSHENFIRFCICRESDKELEDCIRTMAAEIKIASGA